MNADHNVEEVRKARESIEAKFNFDIKLIIAEAQKKQKQSKHKVVSFQTSRVSQTKHSA